MDGKSWADYCAVCVLQTSLWHLELPLRYLGHFNIAEEHSTCLTNWSNATVEESVEKILEGAACQFDYVQGWGETPDVIESDAGKLASPAAGIYPDTEIS